MRLHHLSVSAFGPFADTQTVDFEELNDAGLFLLTGATGAGKSSLLDAVCFALYGTVPGGRGTKLLKSQHAPVEARPEVVLDFSVQGRRLQVRRTPEWTRPKRRGSGVTAEKAAASVSELVGGQVRLLSSRAAEVGVLVRDLMGMDAGQFVQVALLPQGQFQTFLHASSQDRHDVLQQLFRTDRFARIEDWVHDRSRLLHGEAERGRSTVQRLLDSVADRAAAELPENLSGDALAASTARDEALPWVDALRDDAVACSLRAEETHRASRDRVVGAREGLTRRRQLLELVERRDAVRAARSDLAATEAESRAAVAELEADGRAARAEAVLALRARAEHDLDASRASAARAASALMTSPVTRELAAETPTAHLLTTAADELGLTASRLRAVAPRVRLARDSLAGLQEDEDALAAAAAEAVEIERRSGLLPDELDRLATLLDGVVERAGRAEALQLSLAAARHRHAAAAELLDVDERVASLEDERRQARDRAQDARDLVQDLVSRRLAGMAAELATGLADQQPCPVCGSTEHPQRAVNPQTPVTDEDHESADRVLAEARARLERVDEELHQERARRDGLRTATEGAGVDKARLEVERLGAALLDADQARRERPALERRIADRRAELADLGARATETAATVSRLEQGLSTQADLLRAVVAEVRDMLGPASLDDSAATDVELVTRLADEVEGRLGEVERARTLLLAARDAVTAVDTEAERLADLDARVLATASELGFATVTDLESARLPTDRRSRLEDLLVRRAAAVARAEAMEEELLRSDDVEVGPDLDDAWTARAAVSTAEAAVQAAEEESERSAREAHLCADRVESLTRLRGRLEEALVAWAPLRDESLRAASMSRLVRGQGGDNRLQMRLSAYVLATRLDQVVAAANERLGHMRDQRYLLRRTGRAERRGVQAGLGLEVVDQWTGDVRPPATLSGGETFVVSLALALGLADVVTHEAGGTEVETLFVDEGFGTLDADTLDDVMDRLDGLRAGGRTVGVVSHVSELRSRIPTQVLVDKGRTGSTVRVRTLVG